MDVGEHFGPSRQFARARRKAVELQHICEDVGIGAAGQRFGRVQRHGRAHTFEQVADAEAVPVGEERRPRQRFGLALATQLRTVAGLAVRLVGGRAPFGLGVGVDAAPDGAAALASHQDERGEGGRRQKARRRGQVGTPVHSADGKVKAMYSPL
jgi:hypothetical protein